MRRDMDLIRELLLKLEAMPVKPGAIANFRVNDPRIAIEGYSEDEIYEHLSMIYGADFASSGTREHNSLLDGSWNFRTLTWTGRDFLDAVREPKVWSETKSRAEKVGGWTVVLLADLAKGYIKAKAAEYGFPLG